MTDIITVPLSKLVPWHGNVRKTGASDGIDELAASIAAHGLLQSLVIKKDKRGKYAVIAGQRRYLALQSLAKHGTFAKDYPVPCHLIDGDADGTELSLAENIVRMPMHPADQFEAFRQVIDDGASVTDVAARFGVAESTVEKRLRLGRLSPAILSAYREDGIDLEQAMAFTVGDDHASQERVFAELAGRHISPRAIRNALTQGEIQATDRRAQFVGLEAYEAAGGKIRRDLFDDENAGYLQDATLLDALVAEKLRAIAPEVQTEGWRWVEIAADLDYSDLSKFRRLHPQDVPLATDKQAELDALAEQFNTLNESADPDDDDAMQKLDELESRIDALQDTGEFWPAETLAVAGAIVTLGYDGMPEIRRGLVRPDDADALAAAAESTAAAKPKAPKPAMPASLMQDLTAQRTAAIGAMLANNPHVALAAIVHTLAGRVFYGCQGTTCLGITAKPVDLPKSMTPADCKALATLESERDLWDERLPGDQDDLWSWCLDQPNDVLLHVLAFCAARTADATVRKHDPEQQMRLPHAGALAAALGLDMTAWFVPTTANYFARVSRDQIAAAYCEAKGHDVAPAWLKLKKAEMAQRVAQALDGTGWLPEPLRMNGAAADVTPDTEEEPAVLSEAAE